MKRVFLLLIPTRGYKIDEFDGVPRNTIELSSKVGGKVCFTAAELVFLAYVRTRENKY